MKLAVCGKGGSGKSTITALLARSFSKRGFQVLVIDSDESNSGLYRKLGMKSSPIPIMDMIGGRKGFKEKKSAKIAVGSGAASQDLLVDESLSISDIAPEHIASRNGISLVIVGKIEQAMEGCACPMGVVNREFLHKLNLNSNQIVIVDTEAGLEHFGRGLETTIDGMVIVVDPSFESIDYAEKAFSLAKASGIDNIWVIINKANSDKTVEKLQSLLDSRNIPLTDHIDFDDNIFETELEGQSLVDAAPIYDLDKVIDLIIKAGTKG
jgi:CO dehydrogenase maturation factor